MLISHTLLSGFFFRVAQVLYDYYRQPALAAFFLLVSLLFAIPLLINMFDLWARTVAAVKEEGLAEKILKCSITIHNTFWGRKNAYMSEKQAMLASIYYDTGKTAEADALFRESWQNYKSALIKLPWLHQCFSDWIKLLSTAGDTALAKEVQAELDVSRGLYMGQKIGAVLITAPLVTFLLLNQLTERDIAKHNAHGQIVLALNEISQLAHRESLVLGEYAAARVYADYAQAFDDTDGQLREMVWCSDKALTALNNCGTKDNYLNVLLLNLKAKACLADGKTDEGKELLKHSAAVCSNWDTKQLARNKYDASLERDRCLITLAELERNSGNYKESEASFISLLGASGSKINTSSYKSSCAFFDPVETVDRLHRFEHVEQKLGKNEEAIALQKKVCDILTASVRGLTSKHRNSPVCDFGVREASRELDVCAYLLQESGREKEAKQYHDKADELRIAHRRNLHLDVQQQTSVVDETTKITDELLAVKYKAGDWKQSLTNLLKEDLMSKKARGALTKLPWYEARHTNIEHGKSVQPNRHLEIDIAPMSIRNNREGDGFNVDVQGTVKIYSADSKDANEQRFNFAYIVRGRDHGRPQVDDLLDNQVLATFSLN